MKAAKIALAIALVLVMAGAAQAASISWTATGASSDSVVRTDGALVYAYNTGDSPASITVNGVTFPLDNGAVENDGFGNSGTDVTVNDNTYVSEPSYSDVGGDLGVLLNKGAFGSDKPTTVTLNNLTSGNDYLIQMLVHDIRYGGTQTYTVSYGTGEALGHVYNTSGDGASFVGLFTADATSQAFDVHGTGIEMLNALQLRDVTAGAPIPEPAGIGLIGVALLSLRRRRGL